VRKAATTTASTRSGRKSVYGAFKHPPTD